MLPPSTLFSSPLLTLDFAVYVSTPSFVPSRTDGVVEGGGGGQGLLFPSGFFVLRCGRARFWGSFDAVAYSAGRA